MRTIWLICPGCNRTFTHEEQPDREFVSAYCLCRPGDLPVRMQELPSLDREPVLASSNA